MTNEQLSDDDKFRLGQIAYEAYAGSESFRSTPMPKFQDLPIHIQLSWVGAALAVLYSLQITVNSDFPLFGQLAKSVEMKIKP